MRTLDQLVDGGLAGRTVLVRSDLNVPLDGERITDDGRIRASVPTIAALRCAGAKVVVAAHLGRPNGGPSPELSLAPVAARLAELLGSPVRLVSLGDGLVEPADREVVLLENIRFDPRETTKNDAERAELARELAALAGEDGAFVSDGFGVVHRKQASVYDVAQNLPAYAGGLVAAEVEVLRTLTGERSLRSESQQSRSLRSESQQSRSLRSESQQSPERPFVVVLGGSKVSDKLAVIEALLPKVDTLLVGGGMCFTFLAAQGHGVGASLLEKDRIDVCRELLASGKIVLPTDVVVADEFATHAAIRVVSADAIPDGWMGLDIGPVTVQEFGKALAGAATVFWNGPMGVFELVPFAQGTRGVAQAIVDSGAYSVVGGGDSAAAVRLLGLPEDGFSHISTGGGASLEYLEGKTLPGLAVLEQ